MPSAVPPPPRLSSAGGTHHHEVLNESADVVLHSGLPNHCSSLCCRRACPTEMMVLRSGPGRRSFASGSGCHRTVARSRRHILMIGGILTILFWFPRLVRSGERRRRHQRQIRSGHLCRLHRRRRGRSRRPKTQAPTTACTQGQLARAKGRPLLVGATRRTARGAVHFLIVRSQRYRRQWRRWRRGVNAHWQ